MPLFAICFESPDQADQIKKTCLGTCAKIRTDRSIMLPYVGHCYYCEETQCPAVESESGVINIEDETYELRIRKLKP